MVVGRKRSGEVVQGGGVGQWESVLRMVRADLVGVDRPG